MANPRKNFNLFNAFMASALPEAFVGAAYAVNRIALENFGSGSVNFNMTCEAYFASKTAMLATSALSFGLYVATEGRPVQLVNYVGKKTGSLLMQGAHKIGLFSTPKGATKEKPMPTSSASGPSMRLGGGKGE